MKHKPKISISLLRSLGKLIESSERADNMVCPACKKPGVTWVSCLKCKEQVPIKQGAKLNCPGCGRDISDQYGYTSYTECGTKGCKNYGEELDPWSK